MEDIRKGAAVWLVLLVISVSSQARAGDLVEIEIEIASEPAGALVVENGVVIGKTPHTWRGPVSNEAVSLVLEHSTLPAHPLSFVPNENRSFRVELKKALPAGDCTPGANKGGCASDDTPPSQIWSTVRISALTIAGPLETATAQASIESHFSALRFCHDLLLREIPEARGNVDATFEVLPNGNLTSILIAQNTVFSLAIAPCISHKIRTWRLPKTASPERAKVSLQLAFDMR